MKCPQARLWLLEARPTAALPGDIQRHFDGCPECRRLRHRLGRLEDRVRELPLPPSDPAVKERLWQRLDQFPRPTARLRGAVRRAGAVAVVAGLLLGLGWFLGRQESSRPVGVVREGPTAPGDRSSPEPRAGPRPIAPRIVAHDVRLAGSPTATEQLDALAGMAHDLRAEALYLAGQGAWDELALVADLYDRVVRRGVVEKAKAVPVSERPTLVPLLLRQLHAAEAEVDALSAELVPAAADLLRPIAQAARDGSASLRSGADAAGGGPAAVSAGASEPLLKALVLSGLQLAEEADPLRRADLSSALAEQLARATVLVSARGDVDQAAQLGAALAVLLDRGVDGNLSRAEISDPDRHRRAEADQVRRRSARAVAVLERNLSRAPAAARAGLRQALRTLEEGRDAAGQDGPRGLGPPWLRDDKQARDVPRKKSSFPPGQWNKAKPTPPRSAPVGPDG